MHATCAPVEECHYLQCCLFSSKYCTRCNPAESQSCLLTFCRSMHYMLNGPAVLCRQTGTHGLVPPPAALPSLCSPVRCSPSLVNDYVMGKLQTVRWNMQLPWRLHRAQICGWRASGMAHSMLSVGALCNAQPRMPGGKRWEGARRDVCRGHGWLRACSV